jgi:PIN domain nuclease of toxin-antitoxin system
MRFLLDSHAFLWFVLKDPRLSSVADIAISDPANDIYISPATYWEIAIKVGLGKLDLTTTYDDFMERGIDGNDLEILPIFTKHTSLLTVLPRHHKDPFDWLIIAQALVEKVDIIGADVAFDRYGVARCW